MGDATINFRFDQEDRVQRARTKIDTNQDHIVSDAELASNPSEKQNLDTLLPGAKLPLTSSTTPTTQEYLKSGSGVVSNRSLFSIPHKDAGADITEMNIGDASNSQRLRAAGLTEAQLYNSQNIFVHLGQQNGKDQYGFYSKGFGDGDERAGVVTVGADGKISSSLGAGWSAADPTKQAELKAAFDARAKLVTQKFQGDFQAYKQFETARAQVDDLLARGDVIGDVRKNLTSLKTDMANTSTTDFNASSLQTRANALLNTHSATLQQIRQAEAAGKVADGANTGMEANLDTALKDKTNEVNTITAEQKTAYLSELDAYNNKLNGLKSSNDPKIKAFLDAQKHLESKKANPDKTTLAELKWQNARFDRMIKDDQAFKTAVEAKTKKATTPATPTPPATPPATPSSASPEKPSTHKSAKEMATELGTKFYEQELLGALEQYPDHDPQSKFETTGESGYATLGELVNSLDISLNQETSEMLITQGDKHFLYNRNLQTARSLTPVTGSQDAFYDASEPSTLLLRNDSQFSSEKNLPLSDPHNPDLTHTLSDKKTYIFKDGKWQLIS